MRLAYPENRRTPSYNSVLKRGAIDAEVVCVKFCKKGGQS